MNMAGYKMRKHKFIIKMPVQIIIVIVWGTKITALKNPTLTIKLTVLTLI